MKTFTDNAGRTWTVAIHVAAVKRVRGLLGIDIYGLVDDSFAALTKLLADPVALVDLLYCLCQEEASARQVSDEDFGRAMGGDAIERATDAFLEELIDFFPDARVRASLRKVIEAGRKVRDNLLSHAETMIATIDPSREAQRLIDSSGSLPAQLVSTPDPSPSENSS